MSEGDISKQEQLEAAEKRLDRLLGWISRSDTKFSIILGVNIGMLGFVATSTPASAVPVVAIVLAAVSVALLVASLIFIYRGTYPHTKGPSKSLVYFGAIAGKDLEDLKERFRAYSSEDHLDDVLEQLHRNSEILDRKFEELQWAYRCLVAAVIPWAVTLYLFGMVPPFA